ncbi:Uncharacterized protein TCM_011036 [Theobroma cacao]|uniref:Uncharacterized protein n=1 Tax=Theobroma cacao TaxID=3641 RepID=A0A061E801_THECC|nr:Uncharacterized protein TCM_011036 [Theobroma cacao]
MDHQMTLRSGLQKADSPSTIYNNKNGNCRAGLGEANNSSEELTSGPMDLYVQASSLNAKMGNYTCADLGIRDNYPNKPNEEVARSQMSNPQRKRAWEGL